MEKQANVPPPFLLTPSLLLTMRYMAPSGMIGVRPCAFCSISQTSSAFPCTPPQRVFVHVHVRVHVRVRVRVRVRVHVRVHVHVVLVARADRQITQPRVVYPVWPRCVRVTSPL